MIEAGASAAAMLQGSPALGVAGGKEIATTMQHFATGHTSGFAAAFSQRYRRSVKNKL